jgi:hypothetical protein
MKILQKFVAKINTLGDEVFCLAAGVVILVGGIYCYIMDTISISTLSGLYILGVVLVSIYFAGTLDVRLMVRNPAARRYGWGFYSGCMGVACAPAALLMMLFVVKTGMNGNWIASGKCLVYTVFFTVNVFSGWFIIRRKRWAWVVGTIFSCNIFVWIINYYYGRNRWAEFVGDAYISTGQKTMTD